MASLADNVARAIKVFGDIKTTLIQRGAAVEIDTPVEEYPNKINDVCQYADEKGFRDGYNEGADIGYEIGKQEGIEEGRQAQYDELWDEFQQNGTRTEYGNAFRGYWTDKIFKPKYDLVMTNFQYCFQGSRITNIKQSLEECGRTLRAADTNVNTAALYYAFSAAATTHIPELNFPTITNYQQAFSFNTHLVEIEKITVAPTASSTHAFTGCTSLSEIRYGSEIANDVNFQYCPLSKASILNIFDMLSSTTEGKTVTFKKTAVNTAFGINVDDETTYTDEWKELMASKPNWNIAFAGA